jgi:DNA-binding response OmpR family regulator
MSDPMKDPIYGNDNQLFETETKMSASLPRILIVEDEIKLLNHLVDSIRAEGFSVFTCSSYRELENLLTLPVQFDAVILDRLLHGRDSAELLNQAKQIFEARVMILSAINTSSEKAALIDAGADDYLAKPFDGEELAARLRALLRRDVPDLKLSNVVINSTDRTILVDNSEIPLPNKEFVLLRTLAQTPGRIFNKAFLYKKVWEMNPDVESNVVETTVNKLRRRLKEAGARVNIRNARNSGYWIEE